MLPKLEMHRNNLLLNNFIGLFYFSLYIKLHILRGSESSAIKMLNYFLLTVMIEMPFLCKKSFFSVTNHPKIKCINYHSYWASKV